jgi:hypothetical protein
MKNPRTTRKLTLTAETIAHLRQLAPAELGRAGGGRPVESFYECPKTTKESDLC